MTLSPKKKRGPETALKPSQLTIAYRILSVLQMPFGFWFWKIEQLKARIDIEQERRRG